MTVDAIQKQILNALLDKYERSAYYSGNKQPDRRIMLKFYTGGKSDYPSYDIENSERRININRAAESLSGRGYISFNWMAGEYGHIIEKVWLNFNMLDTVYGLVRREPKGDKTDGVYSELIEIKNRAASGWLIGYAGDAVCEIVKKRDIPGSVPADDRDRKSLFTALAAIDKMGGAECMERVFSLRTFGDTKIFERSVKPRILRILRKYLEADDDATDEDVLKQIGLVKYPEQFEFCGDVAVSFEGDAAGGDRSGAADSSGGGTVPGGGGAVGFGPLRGGGSIYSTEQPYGRISVGAATRSVITIENRANYFEYISKYKSEYELAIYHGGQCSPRKKLFLRSVANALPEGCAWRHWGDIDYGGFLMLSRLRNEIIPSAVPYRMDISELSRYREYTAPVGAQYAGKLNSLLAKPELLDCHGCIKYMIANKIRLEQEAMLTDTGDLT